MKKIIALIFFAFPSSFCNAQKDTSHIARNTFYLEVGGNGLVGSINYERFFYQHRQTKFSGRIGLFTGYPKYFFSSPLELCCFEGKKANFEIGMGITYCQGIAGTNPDPGNLSPRDYLVDVLYSCARIGFRYQKEAGGFFLRFGIGYIKRISELYKYHYNYTSDGIDIHDSDFTIGLGIGYTFKKRKHSEKSR